MADKPTPRPRKSVKGKPSVRSTQPEAKRANDPRSPEPAPRQPANQPADSPSPRKPVSQRRFAADTLKGASTKSLKGPASKVPMKIVSAVAAVAIVAVGIFGVTTLLAPADPCAPFSDKLAGIEEATDDNGIVHGTTASGINYTVHGRQQAGATEGVVSLAAVGDQLASENALTTADANAGTTGDGTYDFAPYYKETGSFIGQHDLKFINQETITNEANGWLPAGYPTFNGPDEMIDVLDQVGFNLVSFCSNHVYDIWTDGIEATHANFAKYPNILVAGSYASEEDRNTVHLIERNGITFAMLAYGYGENGYKNSELPNDYYVTMFDEDTAKADIARAKEVADVVIVYMHWGEEYNTQITDTQAEQAQFLADQNIDLVLGSHNHVTQPINIYTSESGKDVPVVFGMSDFISGYRLIDTIMSGVFTCDFMKGEDSVTIENMKWYPCIEWSDSKATTVRMIKDMTPEEINANTCVTDCDDDYAHIQEYYDSLDMDVEVVLTNEEEQDKA